MPWTKTDYPPSMKNLDTRIRDKAVDIANALLHDGYEEGRAIAIATSQAEEWNENHPQDHEHSQHRPSSKHVTSGHKKEGSSGSQRSHPVSSSRQHENIHVVPYEDGWAIKEEGHDKPSSTFDTKNDAVKEAKKQSNQYDIRAIIHDQNGKIVTSEHY